VLGVRHFSRFLRSGALGADKAEMVRQVLEGKNTPPLPSQRVQSSDGKLLWMLDEAAATKLTR
jgi:6-phosphogluconolactonase/glucosamine-6-phosphate isomerase/deaminase